MPLNSCPYSSPLPSAGVSGLLYHDQIVGRGIECHICWGSLLEEVRSVISISFLCPPSSCVPRILQKDSAMSTFRQEDVEDHYEMGEELGR